MKRIRQTVEADALREFAARKSRKPMVHASEVERLEREKTRLEQTIIEQSVELSLLKKREWKGCTSLLGCASQLIADLTGQRLDARLKRAVLQAIHQAKMSGMRVDRACDILQLPRNRYYAWKQRLDRVLPSDASDTWVEDLSHGLP